VLVGAELCMLLKLLQFGKQIINTWKRLKSCIRNAGEYLLDRSCEKWSIK